MQRLRSHDSPAALRRFLEEEGLAPSRRFGQNFLISTKVRKRIIDLLDIERESSVWEIGPGLGAMSETLAEIARELTLFEIDRRFAEYLREVFRFAGSVEVVEGDFLKTWRDIRARKGSPDRIIGNLPYNAASHIIASLLEGEVHAPIMVFTVQKEVALRMMAGPGGKEYSSLSVLCGLHCTVFNGGDIAAGSFYPAPKVVSKVVVLKPHNRYKKPVRDIAASAARDAFSSRRKTIANALKSGVLASRLDYALLMDALQNARIDPALRGEKLTVQQFVDFALEIEKSRDKS
ncbi:MAG: 16S rRNA (adenine(1518)-N(6)/adenine(1519)-N(6))-dimethyltransferase RsmA [Spirochaetia bacterium]